MDSVRIYAVDPPFDTLELEVCSVSAHTPTLATDELEIRPFSPGSWLSTPVYPSSYWARNPGKPGLAIYNLDAGRSYSRVSRMLNDVQWDDKIVSTFLVRVIEENDPVFQVTSTTAWTADGRNICAANSPCTPLNLLQITEDPPPIIQKEGEQGTKVSRLSRFYSFIMLYRKTIAREVNETHRTKQSRRLNVFFKTRFVTHMDDIQASISCIGKMTSGYKAIICALDMFFFKHYKAPFAHMRVATLPTRYRGCVALALLGQVSRVAGLTPDELVQFIFTASVFKDLTNIAKAGEGIGDAFGYFPYHVEFGMTSKSAYSSSVNRTLCFWLHVISGILGCTKSLNARILYPRDLPGTFQTAAAVALHVSGSADVKIQSKTDAAKARELWTALETQASEDAEVIGEEPPAERTEGMTIESRVNSVLGKFHENNGLSQEQKDTLHAKFSRCRTDRLGTVGSYCYYMYG